MHPPDSLPLKKRCLVGLEVTGHPASTAFSRSWVSPSVLHSPPPPAPHSLAGSKLWGRLLAYNCLKFPGRPDWPLYHYVTSSHLKAEGPCVFVELSLKLQQAGVNLSMGLSPARHMASLRSEEKMWESWTLYPAMVFTAMHWECQVLLLSGHLLWSWNYGYLTVLFLYKLT